MKPIKSLLILCVLAFVALGASEASAQYYNGPPPNSRLPGGFHNRMGRLAFGFSLGVGGMSDSGGDITCTGCDYNPLSAEVSGHIGGFLTPRFALLGEVQGNIQTLSFGDNINTPDTQLVQSALMIAGQYWLTPQLWIKGGIGFADLRIQDSFGGESRPEGGMALMGAVGIELFSARYLAVDLQGRLLNGSYKGIDDNITAASVGIGINWY